MLSKNKVQSFFEKFLLASLFALIISPCTKTDAHPDSLPSYNYSSMLNLMQDYQIIRLEYYNNHATFMHKKDAFLKVIKELMPKLSIEKEQFASYMSRVKQHNALSIKQQKKLASYYTFLRSTLHELQKITNGIPASEH